MLWRDPGDDLRKHHKCGVLLRVMVYGHDFPLDAQNRYFFGQGADLARADHLRDSIKNTEIAPDEIRSRLTAIQTHLTEVLDDMA